VKGEEKWRRSFRFVELAAVFAQRLESRIVQVVLKLTGKPNYLVQARAGVYIIMMAYFFGSTISPSGAVGYNDFFQDFGFDIDGNVQGLKNSQIENVSGSSAILNGVQEINLLQHIISGQGSALNV